MNDDPALLPASNLVAALRRGEMGSLELLDHYLQRVAGLNAEINAVVTMDIERARLEAKRADDLLSKGESIGPLHGLPITVKDSFETAGLTTTSGAPELWDHVPVKDAVAVGRYRAAGAVIFGKTNLPKYADDVQTYNDLFGTTNNPWDLERTPGGSSGGAAAALATGLSGLELGSDMGGSIRIPAHFCGVFGLKPTYGIIPLAGHIPGPPGTLLEADVVVAGPMGRSADDLELALSVLAGPDEERASGWRIELPPARRSSLAEYRVAVWLDDPECPVASEVVQSLAASVEELRRAGAKIDERPPPVSVRDAARLRERLVSGMGVLGLSEDEFAELRAAIPEGPPLPGEPWSRRVERAMTQRHRYWLQACDERAKHKAAWREFFRDYDIFLTPPTATPAFRHDQSTLAKRTIAVNGQDRPYFEATVWWAGFVGVSHLPAVVAPARRTPSGLPVGFQIVASHYHDFLAIDFARKTAEVLGGFEPPPGY